VDAPPLVVSIFSVLVAACAGVFTYKQLKMRHVEYLEGQEPRLQGRIEYESPAGHRLHLELKSSRPVTVLNVRFAGSDRVEFVEDQNGSNSFRIERGRPVILRVSVPYPYPPQMTLEATCTRKTLGETWPVRIKVPVFEKQAKEKPILKVEIDQKYPPPHNLKIKLASRISLASLEASIVDGHGVRFVDVREGALKDRREPGSKRNIWERLGSGGVAECPIIVEEEHSSEFDLKLTCRGPMQYRWDIVEKVKVPTSFKKPGKPQFKGEIRPLDPPPHLLELQLLSLWPLASLEVAIASSFGFRFVLPKLTGETSSGEHGIRVKHGPLLHKEVARWHIALDEFRPDSLLLDIACSGQGGERLEPVRITIWVPYTLRAS
jgi:hypothetical protein